MTLNKKVREDIESNKDNYIKYLQAIVQEPSTIGDEAGAQKIVEDRLRANNLVVDVWTPEHELMLESEYYNPIRENYAGSQNVVGVLKGSKPDGRSVILNGHIDVVPAGDLDKWKNGAYSGKVVDGKLYGRGTTDMKGGNVAILIALETVINLGIKLKGDVIYQSVIEEETGGAGTISAIQRGYKADIAIIPEPSEMKIFPKQQGSLWFKLKVKGISAHGGTRYEGVSAVEKGITVFNQLLELEETRNVKYRKQELYKDNPIPIPINIGQFNSGIFPSSVPEETIIQGRYGVGPDETINEAKAQFQKMLDDLVELDDWFRKYPVTVKWEGIHLPPGGSDLDHPMLNILKEKYEETENEKPIVAGSTWGTDGGLLTQYGDTPSIIFGPGTTSMAHFTDEYIELDKLFKTAEIIALSIIDWCEIDK